MKLVHISGPGHNMPPTVKVKSADDAVRKQRKAAAQRVIAHFVNKLPDLSLLCFFDDEDWQALRGGVGAANRGAYVPVTNSKPPWWPKAPDYRSECLVVEGQRAFDHFIYLHGSTCSSEVGLTMTFAHELQHFIQHSNTPHLWAANTLVPYLQIMNALGLRSCDLPHEREARIVQKRTAEDLFGAEVVGQYIDAKIADFVTEVDAADWECIRGLDTSTPYDLAGETKLFFPRLRDYRPQLEGMLQYFQNSDDPAFRDVDLDGLLKGTDEPQLASAR